MVDIEGEPSTIVGGHVNAVTGNFIEREVDIVIPGATPFEIVRKSSRGEKYEHSNYLSHLNLSCFDKVVAETSSKEPDIVISNYDERGGRSTYLIKQDKKKNVKTLPYYVKQLDSGVTNTMDGAISPRNYRPNSHAIYNPETKALFIKTPYGSEKIFRMGHSRSEYHLDTEIFRSGLRSKYEYKNGKWDFSERSHARPN
jgi:hypothetical protein